MISFLPRVVVEFTDRRSAVVTGRRNSVGLLVVGEKVTAAAASTLPLVAESSAWGRPVGLCLAAGFGFAVILRERRIREAQQSVDEHNDPSDGINKKAQIGGVLKASNINESGFCLRFFTWTLSLWTPAVATHRSSVQEGD